MSSDLSKIVVLSIAPNDQFYINYWQKSEKPKKLKISEICSELKTAYSLELSKCENILFIGGSTSKDMDLSIPVISAVSFNDGKLKEIFSFKLTDMTMKFCLKIQRLEEQDGDILLVSG